MHDHNVHYHAGVLATSATGALSAMWIGLAEAIAHGPTWNLVPPILLSVASLLGAVWSGVKVWSDVSGQRAKLRQQLRQDEEIHLARLEAIKTTGRDPGRFVPAVDRVL